MEVSHNRTKLLFGQKPTRTRTYHTNSCLTSAGIMPLPIKSRHHHNIDFRMLSIREKSREISLKNRSIGLFRRSPDKERAAYYYALNNKGAGDYQFRPNPGHPTKGFNRMESTEDDDIEDSKALSALQLKAYSGLSALSRSKSAIHYNNSSINVNVDRPALSRAHTNILHYNEEGSRQTKVRYKSAKYPQKRSSSLSSQEMQKEYKRLTGDTFDRDTSTASRGDSRGSNRQTFNNCRIVKCFDKSCCKEWRTNYIDFFPQRFLPPPIPIGSTKEGLEINRAKGSFRSLFQSLFIASSLTLDICYDEYCPSLQKTNHKGERIIERRTCKNCKIYHSTISAMKTHKRICKEMNKKAETAPIDTDESDLSEAEDGNDIQPESTVIPDDQNIFEQINSCFGL